MSKTLYISAVEAKTGKSAIVLGVMHTLQRELGNVAFFRPIINEEEDHDLRLILSRFEVDTPYEDAYGVTLDEARVLLNSGKRAQLIDTVIKKYKALEETHSFVLCEGSDFLGKDSAFEFELNADIAFTLDEPMLIISSGQDKSVQQIIDSTNITLDLMRSKGLDVVGIIVNRAQVTEGERRKIISSFKVGKDGDAPSVYVVPEEPTLGRPTVEDVRESLGAEVIYGQERMDVLVEDFLIAAMQPEHFLKYLTPGALVITPGDRSDIILATLASRLSSRYPDVSAIVLTGGLRPDARVMELIKGWVGIPLPILTVEDSTYQTVKAINDLRGRIEPDDERKVATALGLFESNVDGEELARRFTSRESDKISPKMFEYKLIEMAQRRKVRIVLPEGLEDRILSAADILLRRNVVDITLLGAPDKIRSKGKSLGLELDAAEIIDPAKAPDFEEYSETYYELRKEKGMTLEQAREEMLGNSFYGTMMVYKGAADGLVSGSIHTTAETIRPALQFIKTEPGTAIVSSVFLMCLQDRVLVFGDCAVNTNPSAEELADIAISSANTARIFGIDPRVAMLSYSTGASGKGEDVDIVVEATRLAQLKAPDLLVEGPLQYDAAIDPATALTKLPGSKVAGRATVFIFPDLNTGNNTYKAVQRAANAVAIGPILQGLRKPVNDLSRGCTVPDIVNTVAITAIQAQEKVEKPGKKK